MVSLVGRAGRPEHEKPRPVLKPPNGAATQDTGGPKQTSSELGVHIRAVEVAGKLSSDPRQRRTDRRGSLAIQTCFPANSTATRRSQTPGEVWSEVTITVSTENPRSCKALALLEGTEQWLKIRRKGDGAKFYVIPGSQGHVYWTNCGECSCPDSQHRGVECNHITAVKLYVAKVQAERPARRSRPLAEAEPL